MEIERTIVPIVARLCSLREIIWKETNHDNLTILGTAMSIDAEFAIWADSLPISYAYLTKMSRAGPNFHGKHYHVYQSVYHVGFWNLYRTSRIITNTHIIQWLTRRSHPIPFHSDKLNDAVATIREMSTDICATVPYVLSDHVPDKKPKAAASFALMWPLYTVAIDTRTLPETRKWVITRFERIGHEMGIQQALSVAMVLRRQHEIEVWDRIQIGKVVDEEEEEEKW